MDLDAWIAIAVVCGTGAISPGPSLAVVLKNTVDGGRARGIACALGHGLGVGVYALVAIVGLTALVAAIQRPVMVAGALYLIWLGVRAVRASFDAPGAGDVADPIANGIGAASVNAASVDAAGDDAAGDDAAGDGASAGTGPPPTGRARRSTRRSGFVEGFAIAFLNPKIAVFFLALLSNLVPAEATAVERSGVAALAMAIDAVWYVIVAAVLAGTGAVDLVRRNGRAMDRAFGAVLLGLGAWLLADALSAA